MEFTLKKKEPSWFEMVKILGGKVVQLLITVAAWVCSVPVTLWQSRKWFNEDSQ